MGQVGVGGTSMEEVTASCRVRRRESDGEEVARKSTALEQSAALSFGGAAPDAVVDAIVERIVETLGGDGTGGADAFRHLDPDAVAGEEHGGGMVLAVAVVHPGGGGFHDRDRTDGG